MWTLLDVQQGVPGIQPFLRTGSMRDVQKISEWVFTHVSYLPLTKCTVTLCELFFGVKLIDISLVLHVGITGQNKDVW